MKNDDLRLLLKQERLTRIVMETTKEFIQNYNEVRDRGTVKDRMTKLDEAYTTFCEARMRIEMVLEDIEQEDEFPDLDESHEAYAKRKNEAQIIREQGNERIVKDFINEYFGMKQALKAFEASASSATFSTESASSSQLQTLPMAQVKLPELTLPSFSGNLRDWQTFRDSFKNLVADNRQLTEIDKFAYLRSCLSGAALQEIGSIDMTAANYSIAWQSLETRYENKKLLVESHLDAIFALEPMRTEDFERLNQITREFDNHLKMLDKLGEDTASWSTILSHMLARKLDPATLRLWETKHRTRDVPRYHTMLQFLNEHCIVLQSIPARSEQPLYRRTSPRKSSSYSGILVGCAFCDDGQHLPFQCHSFKMLNIEERRNAARTGRLCFNCLRRGHFSRDCRRTSCRLCGQRHHTLVHLGPPRMFTRQSVPQSKNRSQQRVRNPPRVQTPSTSQTYDSSTLALRQTSTTHAISSLPLAQLYTQHTTSPTTDNSTTHIVSASASKTPRSVPLANSSNKTRLTTWKFWEVLKRQFLLALVFVFQANVEINDEQLGKPGLQFPKHEEALPAARHTTAGRQFSALRSRTRIPTARRVGWLKWAPHGISNGLPLMNEEK